MPTFTVNPAKTGLLPARVHPSWDDFLGRTMPLIESAAASLGGDFTPPPDRVLRFLERDPASVRVVVLGQDPYPAPGAATGRAFEVGGLTDWAAPFRQVSLKNILRAVYAAYGGEPYSPYRDVLRAVKEGRFNILPPDRLFASWEEQGVLLLNTSLTCRVGAPDSHRDIWRPFTRAVMEQLSQTPSRAWFLWGSDARACIPYINAGKIYQSRHPMMCSPAYDDDFLKNPCFAETMDIVDWRGRPTAAEQN